MKILLVDDEHGVLQIYSDKLASEGYQVITASNGQECLDKAEKDHPDLVLLDIIMPRFNGLDVLKNLKSQDSTKEIPVLLLTNLPAEMSSEKAKTLGASGYLVKAEYDPSNVVDMVNKLFANKDAAK